MLVQERFCESVECNHMIWCFQVEVWIFSVICCACHMFWRAIFILVVVIPWHQFNIRPSHIADVWFPSNISILLSVLQNGYPISPTFLWKWKIDFVGREGSMSTDPSMTLASDATSFFNGSDATFVLSSTVMDGLIPKQQWDALSTRGGNDRRRGTATVQRMVIHPFSAFDPRRGWNYNFTHRHPNKGRFQK